MHRHVRALFVSDVHVGTPGSHARQLVHMLEQVRCDSLYLVGDIIDLQAMHARSYWHRDHTRLLRTIMQLAVRGTQVIYIPGNHDAQFRHFCDREIAGIQVRRHAVYTALDGARFRVSHGDEFDTSGQGKRAWIESLGESLYEMICWGNRWLNRARHRMDMEYLPWSIGVKERISRAMTYIRDFEDRVIQCASHADYDGHICGHIHYANLRTQGDVAYLNDGDWVESLSSLVEPRSGGMELWQWGRTPRQLQRLQPEWWRTTRSSIQEAA